MSKYRTIRKAYQEIKRADPDSCVSEYFIRQIVMSGCIGSKMSGNRYYINLDELEQYLKGGIQANGLEKNVLFGNN